VARGHLAFSSQDYPQAAAWYRRALELDAERAVLWRNLGHALLGAGRDPEAAEAYRTFLRQGGRDPRLARLVKIQPGRPPRPGPEDAASQARGPSTRR